MQAFDVPFKINGATISWTTNYDHIVKYQVIDALTTNQGERLMFPDWGCDILANLFDPGDSLVRADVANHIRNHLAVFVPRATVDGVSVQVDPVRPNYVIISVTFRASDYNKPETIEVGLEVNQSGEPA